MAQSRNRQQATVSSLMLAALCVVPALGQSLERFMLFNACRPMRLVVEGLGDDAAKIGLTEESLQVAAESRLRGARLYTEDFVRADLAYLYVNINVVGRAYSITVHYNKRVSDALGEFGTAITWTSGSTGTSGTGNFIVSGLSKHLDRFLAAYLRVNEDACGSPVGRP